MSDAMMIFRFQKKSFKIRDVRKGIGAPVAAAVSTLSRTARWFMISHSRQRGHCIPQKLVMLRHCIGFETKLINFLHFCSCDAAGGMDNNHSAERAHGESGGDGKGNMDERGQHEMSPSKMSVFKEVKPEQPISIMNVKPEKSLAKTKTTLEFVIVSLC
jgi:hypothetical protein